VVGVVCDDVALDDWVVVLAAAEPVAAVLGAVEDVLVLLVEALPVDAVLLLDLIAFSMAEEPD